MPVNLNCAKLGHAFRRDPNGTRDLVAQALKEGDRISIRDLAEHTVYVGNDCVGREWVRSLNPGNSRSLRESSGAVDSTAFSNITGQLLINALMQGYQSEEFVASRLMRTVPTSIDDEELIPGMQMLDEPGDDALMVREGQEYPKTGFGEDYIHTPRPVKYGQILQVTKESVFNDRTGLLLDNARKVGTVLGINKEKRCLKVILGLTNSYKWRGTSYNTYQTTTPWINSLASTELVDWTDVDAAEQLFADMVDPNTGEPIMISATTMLVMPAYKHTAKRILNATEVDQGGHATGDADAVVNTVRTKSANPLDSYGLEVSKLAYSLLKASGVAAADAKKYWFIGDFQQAFAYREMWPLELTEAPPNSHEEFHNDIVAQFKASEKGVAAVMDPRYVVKVTG
jgi:hypothetical protein